jgi:hypothetical protein
MAGLSLADALKDFAAGPPRCAEPFAVDAMAYPEGSIDFPDFPPMAVPEPVNVEAIVAEAVARAEEALSERLALEHGEALHLEKQRHAEEIAELQQRFAEEATGRIDAGLAEMEHRLVESTSAVAARILGAVLNDDLRDRSVGRLADLVREALRDDEAVRVRVHGNVPLFEMLKDRLPEYAGQFDFLESPDFDLSVTIDESIYETRLAEWSAALAEILA